VLTIILLNMVLGQLPSEVIKLQEDIANTKQVLIDKEKKLQEIISKIPEVLGDLEQVNVQGYGLSNARKILSGPKDTGKYRVISVIGDSYGFLGWLNATRASYGLSAVGYDQGLSNDAAINNQYGMGHTYMGNARRQNAAGNYGDAATVGAVWLASPAHRAALLDPTITMIGIAYNGAVWTFNGR
jgi:hypothetical protein